MTARVSATSTNSAPERFTSINLPPERFTSLNCVPARLTSVNSDALRLARSTFMEAVGETALRLPVIGLRWQTFERIVNAAATAIRRIDESVEVFLGVD